MRHQAIACAFFFLSFHATAQTYLNVDFSRGIPSDFILIDNDQNTPSAAMKKLGFEEGIPWVVASDDNNPVACSTSWYQPKGQSDDWMITPPMTITGNNPELTWRSKAYSQKNPNGYAVYISENGGQDMADFNQATPLFQTTADNAEWTQHRVSLRAYKGKTIRVAFVDNSDNMDRLYIDDIVCAEHADLQLYPQLPALTPHVGNIEVNVTVSNVSERKINDFTVGLGYGGQEYTQKFEQTLQPGDRQTLTLTAPISIENRQTVDYQLWIETGSTRFEDNYSLKAYQRKVVGEEATGTWCGWCVRGLVTLAQMKAQNSDWFIGAAIHYNDPMMDQDGYEDLLRSLVSFSGYPSGVVNRVASCDPGQFGSWGQAAFDAEPVLCAIDLSATLNPQTREVSTHSKLWFAQEQKDIHYALAYTIIENDVHKTEFADEDERKSWAQYNAYAGGESGAMGGFENLPNYVYDMTYQEVVRGYAGNHSTNSTSKFSDFYGIEGSIPENIGADEEVSFDYAFQLPDNVMVDENCEIIVMLVDRTLIEKKNYAGGKYEMPEGHIINAQVVKPTLDTSGITPVNGPQPANVYSADNQVYNLGGTRQKGLQRGLNIVRMADGTTRKVFIK